MNPFTMLDAKSRKVVYAFYGVAALLVACIDVGFASAAAEDPTWLTVAQDVLAYLAAPIGVLAATNTPAAPAEVVEAVREVNADAQWDEGDDILDPGRP